MCLTLYVANFANVAKVNETPLFFIYLVQFDVGRRYLAKVTLATLLAKVVLS
jgi:hypothetical protein